MDPAVVQHASEAEQAQSRCLSLQDLIVNSFPPFKLSTPAKLTLLRLLRAELRFLLQLPSPSTPITSNIGYFESIVRVLLHPAIRNASRLCKPVPSNSAHVDIVCTFGFSPAWFLVSDRNPIRISWSGSLRSRAERTLLAARSASVTLKPTYLFLVFSRGLPDDAASAIGCHLGAVEINAHAECIVFEDLEEGWVGVGSWGMEGSRWFRVLIEGDDLERFNEVPGFASVAEGEEVDRGKDAFGELMSCLRPGGVDSVDLINFDTTALIAMVSGISNGAAERLLGAPEVDLRRRFKGNYKFVIAQATSELEQPILIELKVVLEGKKGIICESARSEFKELMLMCGGANEKFRADQLLKHLLVVPDSPSARISGLPTTRKIAEKNKVIFGTGDHYHAPTLTANMGFVRAISQTGMSLLTIEHRPRALTGEIILCNVERCLEPNENAPHHPLLHTAAQYCSVSDDVAALDSPLNGKLYPVSAQNNLSHDRGLSCDSKSLCGPIHENCLGSFHHASPNFSLLLYFLFLLPIPVLQFWH